MNDNINKPENTANILRQMFEFMWENRKLGEEPERFHPDYKKADEAIDSFCKLGGNNAYGAICDIIKCYAESYYIEGLKQGAAVTRQLFDSTSNPFGS